MNAEQFRCAAHSAVDQSQSAPQPFPIRMHTSRLTLHTVIDYFSTLDSRRVVSDVSPGYLRPLLPSAAPDEGEKWEDIQKDIDAKIMPGLTHWYSIPHPSLSVSKGLSL